MKIREKGAPYELVKVASIDDLWKFTDKIEISLDKLEEFVIRSSKARSKKLLPETVYVWYKNNLINWKLLDNWIHLNYTNYDVYNQFIKNTGFINGVNDPQLRFRILDFIKKNNLHVYLDKEDYERCFSDYVDDSLIINHKKYYDKEYDEVFNQLSNKQIKGEASREISNKLINKFFELLSKNFEETLTYEAFKDSDYELFANVLSQRYSGVTHYYIIVHGENSSNYIIKSKDNRKDIYKLAEYFYKEHCLASEINFKTAVQKLKLIGEVKLARILTNTWSEYVDFVEFMLNNIYIKKITILQRVIHEIDAKKDFIDAQNNVGEKIKKVAKNADYLYEEINTLNDSVSDIDEVVKKDINQMSVDIDKLQKEVRDLESSLWEY